MKTALAIYGAAHIALMCFGFLNLIDYHLCIDAPGVCHITKKATP